MAIVINLIVIVLVGFIAYMWSQEGLFSALIHLVCTVIAGAVALGVWEPVAYLMLGVREDIAWSVGLAVPFLVTLALLRVIMDKAVPYNLKFSPVLNMIGGGAFGAGSGIIAVGILVISMGFLRLPSGFLGYKPITYDSQGNLQRTAGLWLPADKLTAKLYEKLSVAGFATPTPLAALAPRIDEQAALMRITFDDRARNTLSPDDFRAIGRYSVSASNPNELFKDSQSSQPQQARDLDNKPFPAGTTLEGFVLFFEPTAKESGGQVVFGSGQVTLLYEDADGVTRRVAPVAMVSQAKSEGVSYGRFRYDAKDVFLASVGAASTATMAFEFPVPPGGTPTYVLVKNVRVPVSSFAPLPLPGIENGRVTTAQRDAAIDANQILAGSAAVAGGGGGGGSAGPGAIPIKHGGTQISGIDRNDRENYGVLISTNLKETFSKGNRGGLDLNEDNQITGGMNKFASSEISGDVAPKLRVDEFFTPAGTTLVQIDISAQAKLSILGKAYDAALYLMPLQLRAQGETFDAVGYIFKDERGVTISYDLGNPIRSFNQLPQTSNSKPTDKLTVLFLVNRRNDVMIETLQLGPEPIATFNPPMPTLNR
ncbi:MAG: hypothetical protein H6813_07140 [Phycisphaeraceae bacterium]|nr:hypothetical protein [Phycisphaeraceae bacterium]MCB9848272.1 hypothetical protein [Phycisphaeraceae bacterium]